MPGCMLIAQVIICAQTGPTCNPDPKNKAGKFIF